MRWNVIAKDKMPGVPTIPGYTRRCWITERSVLFPYLLVDGKHVTKEILYLVASYSPTYDECKNNQHDVVYKFVIKYGVYECYHEHETPFYDNAPEKLDQQFILAEVLQKMLVDNNNVVVRPNNKCCNNAKVLSMDIGMYDGLPVLNVHVDNYFGGMDAISMSCFSPIHAIMYNFARELGLMSMYPKQLPDLDTTTQALEKLDEYHSVVLHEDSNYYDNQRQQYKKGIETDIAMIQDLENQFAETSQKAADAMNKLSEQYGIELDAEKQESNEHFSRAYEVSRPKLRGFSSSSFFTSSLGWEIKGCSTRFVINVYKSRKGIFMFEVCEYTDQGFAQPLDPKWLRGFMSNAHRYIKDGRLLEFKLVEIGGRLYFKGDYDTERISTHTPPGEEFTWLSGLRGFIGSEWCGGIGDHLATAYIFKDRIRDFKTSCSVFKLMEDVVNFLNELGCHDRLIGNRQNGIEYHKERLAELDETQRKEIEGKNAALEFLKGIGVFT